MNNRDIIIQEAHNQSIDPIVPLSIASVESSFDENCTGDNGTSFGLFQLHRKGLAPDDLSNEQLCDPTTNARIAVSAMKPKYDQAVAQGLTGLDLIKYVAYNSGWPDQLGVQWTETNRPDYTQMLARAYLHETGDIPQVTLDKVPSQSPPDPKNDAYRNPNHVYTVVEGDTLSQIGRVYKTPYDVIARFNRIDNPDVISIGQVIIIPYEYKVVAGDTLSQICEDHGGLDYEFIAAVNRINPDVINTGDVLFI